MVAVDLRDRSGAALSEPDGDATALILHTSGTTGPPKGVAVSRRALAAGLDAVADAWAWTPEDRQAHGLPLFHVHGLVLGVLGPLRVGCSLVHTGRSAPRPHHRGRPGRSTAAWTADGWFVTGDVATIGPDGRHRIVGRESIDLLKTGGFRVGAGEGEAAPLAQPEGSEAAVVGVPDDDLGQRIVAYVVPAGDVALDTEAVIAGVANRLSAHKRPREARVVRGLPRNAMGKVIKTYLL